MKAILDYLAEFNAVTVIIRILVAVLAGALVGLEREVHGRAAGLRTHMMVSLGAALTSLIGLYCVQKLGLSADPLRIGAQVISGIGFLGAGTILLRRGGSHITGLTTAAGVWTAAAIGLAVGIGFYEGALVTVLAVLLIFTLITRLEARLHRKRQRMAVYMEIDSVDAVRPMLGILREDFSARDIQVTPARSGTPSHVGIEALIRIPQNLTVQEEMAKLGEISHVIFVLQNQ
jgi:putative Mg2+ transporter-C (MgtC) family protein